MADEHLTYDDLLRIVELVKSSEQFSEFRLKVGQIEVELRRRGTVRSPTQAGSAPSMPTPTPVANQVAPERTPASARDKPSWPEGSLMVRSPMVGTFFRAPQPGAPPFVDVGQTVEPGTTLCIIEVMKLMNSIPAGAHGTVAQILVDDAAPVEAGQPLIVLQPRSAAP